MQGGNVRVVSGCFFVLVHLGPLPQQQLSGIMASALANESGSPFPPLLKLFVPSMRAEDLDLAARDDSFFFFDWRCTSAPIICAFGARPVKEDEPLPPTTELRPILSPARTASEPAR